MFTLILAKAGLCQLAVGEMKASTHSASVWIVSAANAKGGTLCVPEGSRE